MKIHVGKVPKPDQMKEHKTKQKKKKPLNEIISRAVRFNIPPMSSNDFTKVDLKLLWTQTQAVHAERVVVFQ